MTVIVERFMPSKQCRVIVYSYVIIIGFGYEM